MSSTLKHSYTPGSATSATSHLSIPGFPMNPPSQCYPESPLNYEDAKSETITFDLHSTNVTIVNSVNDAELFLHALRIRSDGLELERNAILSQIHETTLYLQLLQHRADQTSLNFRRAQEDIGKARYRIWRARLNISIAENCQICKDIVNVGQG
ncbi:hypothetical protein C8F01DRAFT_1250067 [Mycena amicta]|nr:hypothetical protein C8F01DRAFT_1250067 [Mycena amicta]